MRNTTPLDYQELRTISPKAARQAILQILKVNKGKVSQTARMLGITRRTVYKAMTKRAAGNLDDASRVLHCSLDTVTSRLAHARWKIADYNNIGIRNIYAEDKNPGS